MPGHFLVFLHHADQQYKGTLIFIHFGTFLGILAQETNECFLVGYQANHTRNRREFCI